MRIATFARWLVPSLLLAILPGCEDHLNQASYERIKVGMTVGEVEGIMGGKGDLETVTGTSISGAGIGSTSTAPPNIYKWEHGTKKITITVKDGKVIEKGLSGI